MHECHQRQWSGQQWAKRSQNARVIHMVMSEALKEQVGVVEVDVSHTVSHLELLVVYLANHLSPA